MKSKALSKTDRKNILDLVEEKALSKWDDSPLRAEMDALQAKASSILHEHQIAIIPEADRLVLNKYSGRYITKEIGFNFDSKRSIAAASWGCNLPEICVESYYVMHSYLPDYIDNESDIVKLLHRTDPTILQRFSELWHLRDCELTAITTAYTKLLNECKSTKQVAENKDLAPFLPEYLLTYGEAEEELTPLGKEDLAIIADMNAK
jgi:hypothetical protein